MSTSSGSSVVSKSFTIPVVGGELTYSEPVGQYAVNFTRTSPEGLYEHNADLPEKAFDPRGANAGIDDPQDGDTSGYPVTPDAAVFSRCAEGGEPVSCSVEERFNKAYNRLWEVPPHKQTTKKKQDPPKSDAGHRVAMRSLFMASKSEPDPETPGTIDPEQLPDDDGDDDPDVDLENQIVTIRMSLFPDFVDASEGGNEDFVSIPLPSDFTNRVTDRIVEGDCNSFIAKLIQAASKYTALSNGDIVRRDSLKEDLTGGEIPYAKDGLDLISKVRAFETRAKLFAAGTVEGSIPGGDAKVLLSSKVVIKRVTTTRVMLKELLVILMTATLLRRFMSLFIWQESISEITYWLMLLRTWEKRNERLVPMLSLVIKSKRAPLLVTR